MSLPIVLEIAVGLVFVYLTLSLIASEVQEIIGTLLQWRAEHLKRSIEQLLAGDETQDRQLATQLSDQLYESPLISSLNYEAQGKLIGLSRGFLHGLGAVYRWLTRSRNVFGQNTSGPSYIPANAFSTTLLDNLRLEQLHQILTESRLRRFVEARLISPIHNIVNDLKASLGDEFILNTELRHFELALEQILVDYQARRVGLSQTFDRLVIELEEFAALAQQVLPESHYLTTTFLRRIHYLRSQLAEKLDATALVVKQIQPTLEELITLLDDQSRAHRELINIATQEGGQAEKLLKQLQSLKVPAHLRKSLLSLSAEVQRQATSTEASLNQLQSAIEAWFDQAMARAGGVYRRNAKAVALLLGVAIAIAINADTLHIVSRLSLDQSIRSSLVQTVDQLNVQTLEDLSANLKASSAPPTATAPATPSASSADLANPPAVDPAQQLSQELDTLGQVLNNTLEAYQLPIGYTPNVLAAQQAAEQTWILPVPRRWLGWLITGLAISMGSHFWFDLLQRVMSVRGSGSKP
jgi:hypothetical protein